MSSTVVFIIFIPILAFILLVVNLIFAPHNPYGEKDSVFECGFHSFLGQNRTQFTISFFIFALLFLLFDLEILLVYPFVVSAYGNDIYGLVIMLIFFSILTLGFAFELGKNALKIDSRQMSSLFLKAKTFFTNSTKSASVNHKEIFIKSIMKIKLSNLIAAVLVGFFFATVKLTMDNIKDFLIVWELSVLNGITKLICIEFAEEYLKIKGWNYNLYEILFGLNKHKLGSGDLSDFKPKWFKIVDDSTGPTNTNTNSDTAKSESSKSESDLDERPTSLEKGKGKASSPISEEASPINEESSTNWAESLGLDEQDLINANTTKKEFNQKINDDPHMKDMTLRSLFTGVEFNVNANLTGDDTPSTLEELEKTRNKLIKIDSDLANFATDIPTLKAEIEASSNNKNEDYALNPFYHSDDSEEELQKVLKASLLDFNLPKTDADFDADMQKAKDASKLEYKLSQMEKVSAINSEAESSTANNPFYSPSEEDTLPRKNIPSGEYIPSREEYQKLINDSLRAEIARTEAQNVKLKMEIAMLKSTNPENISTSTTETEDSTNKEKENNIKEDNKDSSEPPLKKPRLEK